MAILGAPVSLSAIYNLPQYFNLDGTPLAGGKIYTYQSTSILIRATTYCDDTGIIENANPIVLDSSGRMPYPMWLNNEVIYKFVLTDKDGNMIDSVDNVTGIGMQLAPSVGYPLEDFYGQTIGFTTNGAPEYLNIVMFVPAELDNSRGFAGYLSVLNAFGMAKDIYDPSGVLIGYIFDHPTVYVQNPDDLLISGPANLVNGSLMDTYIDWSITSVLYPYYEVDSLNAGHPHIINAYIINPFGDNLQSSAVANTGGSLTESIVYVTYDKYTSDTLTASAVSNTGGSLVESIAYITYSNYTDAFTAGSVSNIGGSLVVTIEYITYNEYGLDTLIASTPTLISGTLA